jgi:hypothetical protein
MAVEVPVGVEVVAGAAPPHAASNRGIAPMRITALFIASTPPSSYFLLDSSEVAAAAGDVHLGEMV